MRRLFRWLFWISYFLITCLILLAWAYSHSHSLSAWLIHEIISNNPADSQTVLLQKDEAALGINRGRVIYLHQATASVEPKNIRIPDTENFDFVYRTGEEWSYFDVYSDTFAEEPGPIYFDFSGRTLEAAHIDVWLIFAAWSLVPTLWLLVFFLRRRAKHLRVQTGFCLHCGYNLTGSDSEKCPECGAARPLVTLSSTAD